MKLYEFEGHRLLARAGVESPFFITCNNLDEVKQARRRLKFPVVAKIQVLSGKRAKSGGIKIITTEKQLLSFCRAMFGSDFYGEEVHFINLAEKVEIEKEHYLSITYDTSAKVPYLIFCEEGGVDIEEIKRKNPQLIQTVQLDPFLGPKEKELRKIFPKDSSSLVDFTQRMWDAFWRWDCRLIEVNPLAWAGNRTVAVDAKVILDDAALVRHRDLDILVKGAVSAQPSPRELEARKIDEEDYRGSAGSTFIELDGDIAILASGGGASLLVMDSLLAFGGRAANYTEYSGNPPAQKVARLTKITLSRDNLAGCLVAGAVANFTDIYETLRGFAEGLREIKPKPNYPIVIRRGGPRQEEAYAMLERFAQKEGFDIHLLGPETPISVASKEIVELSEKFKKENLKK